MDFNLLKKPTGWIPVALSIGALTIPYLWILVFGPEPTGDEGGAAHLWQLLMAAQVFAIFVFVIINLTRGPKKLLPVLVLQILFVLVAAAPVFILQL